MANESLKKYLNDHLSGSVVALEILDHLQRGQSETEKSPILADLRADITADRLTLETFVAQLGIDVSRTRQVTAWLTEKLSEPVPESVTSMLPNDDCGPQPPVQWSEVRV